MKDLSKHLSRGGISIDHVSLQTLTNGDVLRDAANPLDAFILVANREHCISNTAYCAVWTDNAILLNHQFPQQCSFHPTRGALPVVGMNGFGPIIASLITGPPPKTVKRRTQVLELACVDVQYPQNVGRMLRKLAKPLFLLADPLLCAFLRIYILQDRHRPLDLSGRVAKGGRAHPHPDLTSVVCRVDE